MVQHSDMQSPLYTKAIEHHASQCISCYNTIQFNIIPAFYCPTTRLHKDIFSVTTMLCRKDIFLSNANLLGTNCMHKQIFLYICLLLYRTYVTSCSLKQNPRTQPNISVTVFTLWFSLCKLKLRNADFSQLSDKRHHHNSHSRNALKL